MHFNHDHEYLEIAQLEKWDALAQKFFRAHKDDLRFAFVQRWAGQKGRFKKEMKKLGQNFLRNCSNKNTIPRPIVNSKDSEDDFEASSENRDRRSEDNLRVAHNPGRRMKHIVRNVEKWTEVYLTGCSNQKGVTDRWRKFVLRWETEIAKNPIFQQEYEKEED